MALRLTEKIVGVLPLIVGEVRERLSLGRNWLRGPRRRLLRTLRQIAPVVAVSGSIRLAAFGLTVAPGQLIDALGETV